MSDIVIGSGQTVSGLLIGGGTEVTVSGGGTLLGATVATSGTLNDLGGYLSGTLVEYEDSILTIGAGGVAVGTTLTAGAWAFVSSGGILSDTLVSGPGSYEGYYFSGLQIGSGGVSISSFVLSGGTEYVQPGGVASLTSLGSGGFLDVAIGGSEQGTVFSGGSASIPVYVISGETVSGLDIGADQVLVVLSGGTAVDTSIEADGFVYVSAGGLASDTTLVGTGIPEDTQFIVSAGGIAVDTFIGSGTEAGFYSGSTALFVTVSSGGWLYAAPGAVTSGFSISSGATTYVGDIVSSGETLSGVTVSGNEVLVVLAGGTVLGGTVEPGGGLVVSGTVSGIVLSGLDSELSLDAGGTTIATAILGGAYEFVSTGAVAIDTFVSGAASSSFDYNYSGLGLGSGASSISTTLVSGGYEFVFSGGTASATTVSSGGSLTVYNGGSAIGTVLAGGSARIPVVIGAGSTVSGVVVSANETVLVSAGATAIGTVVEPGGALDVLAGGSVSDTRVSGGVLVISSSAVFEDASLTVESGATAVSSVLFLGGDEYILAGGTTLYTTVSSGGSLTVDSGGIQSGTVVSGGGSSLPVSTIIVMSGQVESGLVIGAGTTLDVDSGGTIISTTAEGRAAVNVDGGVSSDTVLLGLDGFTAAEYVAEGGTADGTTLSSGGVQALYQNGTSIGTTILSGGFEMVSSGSSALSTTVSAGGTLGVAFGGFALDTVQDGGVVLNVLPCFAAGTLILTDRGPVPVEHLVVGDLVITVEGEAEPIAWIGARAIDCRRHPRPEQVRPVRIRAHALGPDQPRRDLFLSPDHAIFAEGVLIPVRHLINGGSVRQIDAGRVTYVHIELARHVVILAEGLAAESYLDTGDRTAFEEGGPAVTLHPVFGSERRDVSLIMEARGYAPLRVTGPEVEAVRARLASADAQQARTVIPQPGGGDAPVRA